MAYAIHIPPKEGVIDAAADTIDRPPVERTHFRALLATNPNYFGNLALSPLPPVVPIQNNTRFEEIGCVGFHPQARRLDAVIFVKLPFGYGGNVCSRGSREYVRFYLSYDNGGTWTDLGDASVTVYDIPTAVTDGRRLEYAVSVPCEPVEKLCTHKNVVLVRAILSWDYEPPPNQPNWPPVWGEVHNTHILVEPRRRVPWYELIGQVPISAPTSISSLLDLDMTATLKTPDTLTLAQVHALYKDKGVEPKRYALPFLQKLLAQPSFGGQFGGLPPNGLFGELGIDPGEVIGPIVNPKDGNTYYEELDCVGFNPASSELSAVFRVKRPYGYSGGLCSAGSREYVTFWADLDNSGTFEICLGTAQVRVYDLQEDIPGPGLEYSVFLPVNFSQYWQNCRNGPRVVPIRAILSWNSPAECPFPNRPPVWGNHEDTLILLPPGEPVSVGDFSPVLYNISAQAVCDIDQATGMTHVGDRPFGGVVYIVGDIPGANGLPFSSTGRIKYRLRARELPPAPALPGPWQPITNSFGVKVYRDPSPVNQIDITQQVDTTGPFAGYYTYLDSGIGTGAWQRISAPYVGLLGVWVTAQPMHGLWEIDIEAVDPLDPTHTYAAKVTHCADGRDRQSVIVRLDETPPDVAIDITGYSTDGSPATWHAAAGCDDFNVGMWIHGTYKVSDDHFNSLSLNVEPSGSAHGATVDPSERSYLPASYAGATGEWRLNTSGMDPCGYIVALNASDRTIVSGGGGWSAHATVGFCLRAAPTTTA